MDLWLEGSLGAPNPGKTAKQGLARLVSCQEERVSGEDGGLTQTSPHFSRCDKFVCE